MKIAEFSRTKNKYKILFDSVKMKNPETRQWQDCVVYQDYIHFDNPDVIIEDGQIYVRELTDFNNKFKII